MFKAAKIVAIATLCFLAGVSADSHDLEPECKTFLEIYGNAKTMAEQMWNGAFTYETNENLAFDMWFLNQPNPNIAKVDVVNNSLPANEKWTLYDIDQCHLEYYHKDFPTIDDHPHHQPESFTECLPWRERACCTSDTVSSAQKLKEGYGEEYHWDRCGPLSPACERFFVQEACFYECEPAAGLYRKYPEHIFDENNDNHNEWQMHGMPIKASFWEEWFAACRNEKFCAFDGGDYFSCAAKYEVADDAEEARLQAEADAQAAREEAARLEAEAARLESELEDEKEKSGRLSGGAIAGIAVGCVVALGALGCVVVMFIKERAGEPVFQPLNREDARADSAHPNAGPIHYPGKA